VAVGAENQSRLEAVVRAGKVLLCSNALACLVLQHNWDKALCQDVVAAAAAAVCCCCSPSEMTRDPFSGNKDKPVLVPQLTVTPEVGRPAKVSVYNIYAGAD
jgi:hypothetical protein